MHRFLTILVTALAVVTSCNNKTPDPVAAAIEAAAMKDAEGDYSFRIYDLAKIDSTTFRTEFDRRKDVFRLKQQTEEKLYWRYNAEGKPKTAESHRQAMEKAKVNLECMDYLEQEIGERIDDVAYYDYVFSGYSETKEGRMTYDKVYVTVTPDYEVLTMTADKRDLHKGTGRVIPGYIETISAELLEE